MIVSFKKFNNEAVAEKCAAPDLWVQEFWNHILTE